jgi:hypothetical protein
MLDDALTPNSPKGRLEYVFKTYWPKQREVVADTLRIAGYAMGMEAGRTQRPWFDGVDALVEGGGASTADGPEVVREMLAVAPPHHDVDFTFPWVARELSKLDKAVLDSRKNGVVGGATSEDYDEAVRTLSRRIGGIARWAKDSRADLMKTTLAEALEKSAGHEVEETEVPQGEVFYTFANGWTAQSLVGQEQLEAEGDVMQHCVGGYCDEVKYGRSVIISLRDPAGNPHVTLEWKPPGMERVAMTFAKMARQAQEQGPMSVAAQKLRQGVFAQIFGKQNEPPAEKYRPYVWELIKKVFDGEPVGMVLSYAPKDSYSFRGRTISDMIFGDQFEDIFEDIDFSGATFGEVQFLSLNLSGAKFVGCKIVRCKFESCSLGGAKFDNAVISRTSFFASRFDSNTSFNNTELGQTKFSNVSVYAIDPGWPSFEGADLDDDTLKSIYGEMPDADFEQTFMKRWRRGEGFVTLVWDPYARGLVPEDEVEPEESEEPEDDGLEDGSEDE